VVLDGVSFADVRFNPCFAFFHDHVEILGWHICLKPGCQLLSRRDSTSGYSFWGGLDSFVYRSIASTILHCWTVSYPWPDLGYSSPMKQLQETTRRPSWDTLRSWTFQKLQDKGEHADLSSTRLLPMADCFALAFFIWISIWIWFIFFPSCHQEAFLLSPYSRISKVCPFSPQTESFLCQERVCCVEIAGREREVWWPEA